MGGNACLSVAEYGAPWWAILVFGTLWLLISGSLRLLEKIIESENLKDLILRLCAMVGLSSKKLTDSQARIVLDKPEVSEEPSKDDTRSLELKNKPPPKKRRRGQGRRDRERGRRGRPKQ
ncbi:hypothetical protein [Lentzea aerocolonigenes]|uniref:hypothetical protein n=1 Tax=Lentzea aerocolonigenes TaxID=68170 RepID=UPI0004C3477A|nr:hypothetical protein [Lentzea aerocolonigenes]MCP2245710.1 hypothetical protein [Lentzea aerocolonigenes]